MDEFKLVYMEGKSCALTQNNDQSSSQERVYQIVTVTRDKESAMKHIDKLKNYEDRAWLQTIIDSHEHNNGVLELMTNTVFRSDGRPREIAKLAPQRDKEKLMQRVMFQDD